MANFDRNVYEPSEEVRLYDSVEEEEDIEGSRLPLLIVLALLVLAMFAGVVWLAYTQGVARGRGETPVLTAANGPERVAPQQPGGTNVPYQGFKIYEQPAPSDDAAEAPPATAANPPAAQTPPAQTPAPVAEAPKPAPSVAAPPPSAPKPAAAAPATPPKSVASLIQQSQTPPAIRPTVPTAPAGPATGAPRSIVPATAPPAATPKPAASGGVALQIGAFKSRAEADAAWRAYSGKHAALLKGYGPDVQEADLGDKGTWYRLRIAGFGDREMASALCDRLKADGGGCFLGK